MERKVKPTEEVRRTEKMQPPQRPKHRKVFSNKQRPMKQIILQTQVEMNY
jgi:hypothetical protein